MPHDKNQPQLSTASLIQLEKPEKLENLLKEDRRDDCLSCRLIGWWYQPESWPWITLARIRGICIHWTWSIQLLLGKASTATAGSYNIEKRLKIWDEISASRNHRCSLNTRGHGSMATDKLKIVHWNISIKNFLELLLAWMRGLTASTWG